MKKIDPIDLINFSALSELMTGHKTKITKTRIQKKHKAKIKELENLIDFWITKLND